jgi:hypothetical protein
MHGPGGEITDERYFPVHLPPGDNGAKEGS